MRAISILNFIQEFSRFAWGGLSACRRLFAGAGAEGAGARSIGLSSNWPSFCRGLLTEDIRSPLHRPGERTLPDGRASVSDGKLVATFPSRTRRQAAFQLFQQAPGFISMCRAALRAGTRLEPYTILLLAAAGKAQVLAPEEIRDPQLRALEQKYRTELRMIPNAAKAQAFPYHFYFSRKLDLEEGAQKGSDQRSIQFDRYQGQVVVKITGNYFVSYSAELMKPEERARQTYQTVMLPLVQASARAFVKADVPQAFALEISHHVRRKVLGVSSESVENVVLVLPKASAERLAESADPQAQQAAVLEGQAFLNAAPISFWPRPEEELAQGNTPEVEEPVKPARPATPARVPTTPPEPTVSARLMKDFGFSNATAKLAAPRTGDSAAARDTSPDAIKDLQKSYQPNLDRLIQDLESQAHFVRYAPPAFIPFHAGLYLQLSLNTEISQEAAGSQYRLAALAFDQHIAHLIRPVLAYFKAGDDFDGIDFSTTARLSPSGSGSPVAVEFIFPLKLLRAYSDFDITGQQLIEAGYVLINGERVSLELQAAEGPPTAR